MLSTYCDAMLLRGDLRHCVTMHPSGCFSRREADRQNQKALRNLSVAFTKDGINYFTLGKELAQAGPKAVDLTFSYNMTTGGVSHKEWVACDCDAASHCYSKSRCDALAHYGRIPSVPDSLVMPDIGYGHSSSTRSMVRFMATQEPFMLDAFLRVFRATCATADGFFVDSGANEGMWTLLAAALGCSAIAIEPQPQCHKSIATSLEANHLSAHMLNALLAPDNVTVMIDTSKPCFGGYQGLNAEPKTPPRSQSLVAVHSMRLDQLPQLTTTTSRIELWHVDVEGAEVMVLRSAAGLFARNKIKRVMVELAHHHWFKYGIASMDEGYAELRTIFHGWHCVWACNGSPFPWTPLTRLGVLRCATPWTNWSDLGWGLFDVFCVAPGAESETYQGERKSGSRAQRRAGRGRGTGRELSR